MTDQTADTARQLPAEWSPAVRDAFWTAVNAPTYEESAASTLAFAQLLAPPVPADVAPATDQTAVIAATARACAAHLRDRYSDTWTEDAARSLELNAARIERGEQTALLRRLAGEAQQQTDTETSTLPYTHTDDDGDQLTIGTTTAATLDGEAMVVTVDITGTGGGVVYLRPEGVEDVVEALRTAGRAASSVQESAAADTGEGA